MNDNYIDNFAWCIFALVAPLAITAIYNYIQFKKRLGNNIHWASLTYTREVYSNVPGTIMKAVLFIAVYSAYFIVVIAMTFASLI